MGMLGADDHLPGRPRRILVGGTSGAGKTTLASLIGQALGIPHTELDSLFHGPNWVPRESFEADVHRFTAEPEWVTEWQYSIVRPLLVERADLLIWIDLPRRTQMRQVVGRTIRRRLRREVLWNGNTEGPFRTFFTDPDHIVRWAWKEHGRMAGKVQQVQDRRPDLPIVRLRSRAEVGRWCAGPLRRCAAAATGGEEPPSATYQPDGL
jgi:adenylate kinase family enzyme